MNQAIHSVDLLRYFLGDVADVSAFYQWRQPGEGPEPMNLPHVYTVNYRFESGVVANATISRVLNDAGGADRSEVIIVCDDALIEWNPTSVVENGEVVWELGNNEENNSSAHQARGFISAVQAGNPSLTRSPYGPSLNSLAAVIGANASAERDGALLSLPSLLAGEVSWNPRAVVGQGLPALE